MKKFLFIGLVLAVLFSGCIIPPDPKPIEKEIPFKSLERDSMSGIKEKSFVVVNTQEEWEDLYKKIHPESSVIQEINFEKNTVIAVFMGEKPYSLYRLEVEKVTKFKSGSGFGYTKVYVNEIETIPGPGIGYPAVMVQPYEIIVIEKTSPSVKVIRTQIKEYDDPLGEIPFTLIEKGEKSNIKEKTHKVFNDGAAFWKFYYNEIHGLSIPVCSVEEHCINSAPFPAPDFEKETVIAVFMGEYSQEYSLRIDKVVGSKTKVTVYATETFKPLSDDIGMPVYATQPYEIISIPKTKLPVEVVRSTIIELPLEEPVDFTLIEKAERSGVFNSRFDVVNNQEEWELLYKEIHSTEPLDDMPGLLEVDFEKYTAVAVFLGERPDSSYEMEIVKVGSTGNEIIVYAVELYKNSSVGTSVEGKVQPYEIILIPKTFSPVNVVWIVTGPGHDTPLCTCTIDPEGNEIACGCSIGYAEDPSYSSGTQNDAEYNSKADTSL